MMKKFYKVGCNICYAILILLACGGVCKNLELKVYFDWFETALCFLSAILARILPDLLFMDDTKKK